MPPRPATPSARSLALLLERAMVADRHRLRRRLQALQRESDPRELARLQEAIDASCARRKQREERRPRPEYPDELPVSLLREEIAATIRHHPVVIVAGETGSGKTTQLPKIALDAGRGTSGLIGCTQPRRIAAISVAGRVASELATDLGHAVGYQIRFDARMHRDTYIKFMTDGILLAETQGDRFLEAYDTLILDEAHERSLNIDFLLGYVKRLLPKRPDLRVVVSSATLDVDRFRQFFDDAPVIDVQGRTYPVEVRWRPAEEEDPDWPVLIGKALQEITGDSDTGDVLIFLPGERDIRDAAEHIERMKLPRTELLPLFGRLTASEQQRVFQPGPARRIVLATNVAETSLTVPRIRYVIDTGLARIKRFNHRTQVEHLQIERVSRASAEQRKGRCGRIGPGICYRLYDEDDFADRDEYTDPEIRRSSLASVILQMLAMNLGSVEDFPFLEPPDPRMIRTGYDELSELGALDEQRRLTSNGKRMAKLPIEPRMARMLLAAADAGALSEMLVIVAALSIQDPRERPLEKQAEADAVHARHLDEKSDFLGWLHLWKHIERETAQQPSNNQVRKWCRQNFLSYLRVREWRDVRAQLEELLRETLPVLRLNDKPASYETVHKCILAGLLSRIGFRTPEKDYQGARGARFVIWPGSGIKNRAPRWLVAAELVETSRLFARCVAEVDPLWIEQVAGDLCRRTHLEPWWDEEAGLVRAYEQVSVFGLPVVERRRVHYGPIDPAKSRAILIRDGLVGGRIRTRCGFYRHNTELVDSLAEMQHKARRSDLLVDEESLIRFYDERLPPDIYTSKALERWAREAARENPRALFMQESDVALETPGGLSTDLFPPILTVQDARLDLAYRFEPGDDADGVTCTVPIGILPRLPAWPFEWLVPGLLPDKVALLLRSLPRSLRRELQPIPESAEACLAKLGEPRGPLLTALSEAVLATRGQRCSPGDFKPDDLPRHLVMRFRVIDAKDKEIASGRDLAALQQHHALAAKQVFAQAPRQKFEQKSLTAWDDLVVPERVDLSDGRGAVWGYPALVDEGAGAALQVFDSSAKAAAEHAAGVRRLLWLALETQLRHTRKSLPLSREAGLVYATLGGGIDALRDEILLKALDHVALDDLPPVRDSERFAERHERARAGIYQAAYDLGKKVDDVLLDAHKAAGLLRQEVPTLMRPGVIDMQEQLARLVFPGFVLETPWPRFFLMPRYIAAIALRLDRLLRGPAKDTQRQQLITPHWTRWKQAHAKTRTAGPLPAALVQVRWLIEEYRVSIFAQEIGASEPVSEKRLAELWREVQA